MASNKLELEQIYAAVSANRHENIIQSSKSHLLYSRSQCVVVHNLKSSKRSPILLSGHTDEVNGQCFIVDSTVENSSEESKISKYIISSSYDKKAIIWELNQEQDAVDVDYKIKYILDSPSKDVFVTRCAIRYDDNQFVSITSTLDGLLQLWNNSEVVQTIPNKYICFHSRIHTISSRSQKQFNFVLLAGSDNRIHIFQLHKSSVSGPVTLIHLLDLTGHSDWVKHLDIIDLHDRPQECLLASASQDSFIRIWHLKLVSGDIDTNHIRTNVSRPLHLGDDSEATYLTATLETVLSGHEGIVHGLAWFRQRSGSLLRLVSCSADKTIIVWTSTLAPLQEQDTIQQLNRYEQSPASAGVWQETFRLGETGETNLPFLGVCLSEDESTLYAQSLRGAIHAWHHSEFDNWHPRHFITGHHEPVTDLAWERTGAYLLSASLDKTCRLHSIASSDHEWHEVTRPQVHGHEINCLASLSFSKFATGAEEKTIRSFEATQFFAKNFKSLTKAGLPKDFESILGELPVHAQLPALGLSNRGAASPYDVGDPGDKTSSNNTWYGISPMVEQLTKLEHLDELPIEEILLQSTLWWETSKLYGHGNELHALAVDSTGSFLASASKANRPDLANILVWETTKFRKVATIEHHSLTVTRLRYSPDNRYLLSVSRDRTWCLSERTGQLRSAYKKIIGTCKSDAIHERIIWDCCWTHDSKHFMTVSRDKKAILWSIDDLIQTPHKIGCVAIQQFEHPILAVDCPDSGVGEVITTGYLFAFGLENGDLELHQVRGTEWNSLRSFTQLHHLPIRRLAFKPSNSDQELLLASAGDDCIVKLTRIIMNSVS